MPYLTCYHQQHIWMTSQISSVKMADFDVAVCNDCDWFKLIKCRSQQIRKHKNLKIVALVFKFRGECLSIYSNFQCLQFLSFVGVQTYTKERLLQTLRSMIKIGQPKSSTARTARCYSLGPISKGPRLRHNHSVFKTYIGLSMVTISASSW